MERPLYSNAFTVAYNSKIREFVLNFDVEYPVLPQQGGASIKEATTERENVCGIVLSEEIALQLSAIITQTMNEAQNNE
ncbi:MAG: hypothetical protein K2O93_09395 [Oscillospiraceae bacterium]|nr:hypothetical protein [Oscillospiraceae bacterium]